MASVGSLGGGGGGGGGGRETTARATVSLAADEAAFMWTRVVGGQRGASNVRQTEAQEDRTPEASI